MKLFYLGLGGFPTGLFCLIILDFLNPIPMIIWTVFCGACIIFRKKNPITTILCPDCDGNFKHSRGCPGEEK